MTDQPKPIRVVFQQPALPKYRVPVFRELSRRPGINFHLLYGDIPGLPNVDPDGIAARHVPLRQWSVAGTTIWWHGPQWDCVSPAMADVAVLSWNLHYANLIPSLLRAKALGVPTILWGHGYSKHEVGWRSWSRRKVGELATALMFYNHTTADSFIKAGWDPRRIHVAINSLDQTAIEQARAHWLGQPEKLDAFRCQHGLSEGPVVLFVSRLDAARRVDMLLQAARTLLADMPKLRVVVIGKGPEEQALRQLANKLNLQDCVLFAGAIYDELQIAPWFLSARGFCFPKDIGLSLLHAFGYGLPVITSDKTEAQAPEIEALQHQVNGLLYTDGSITSLTEALRSLLIDDALAQRLSQGATDTVAQRFNLQKMVDGMEGAIRYCASQRR